MNLINEFNKYFVGVGPNLADKLSAPSKFASYLRSEDSPTGSFFLNPTNCTEVFEIINSFSGSNCEGPAPDRTSPKFYKLGAHPLSIILAEMINDCFQQGYFPACLKIAKVIPIFKEGYLDKVGNPFR